jgi:hypothetical protein
MNKKTPGFSKQNWILAALAIWTVICLRHCLAGVPWSYWGRSWLPSLHPQLETLLGHAFRLGAAAWFFMVFGGLGRALLKKFDVLPEDPWESAATAVALGAGLCASSLLLLGLAGLWHKTVLITLLLALSIPAYIGMRGWRPLPLPQERFLRWAAAMAFLAWAYHLPHALVPETFYDALEYHLGLPNLYVLRGAITATPENSFAGIPSIPAMLYGWTLALDAMGGIAQLLHHGMLLWVCAAIIGLAARIGLRHVGWLAAAIFAWTPVVVSESFRVSVGLEWALLQTAGVSAYLAAATQEPGSARRLRTCLLCGSFFGWAMAVKYPAWSLVFVAAAAALSEPRERRFTLREFSMLTLAPLLWTLPWILKNVWHYGNPIFPFFHERFAPDAAHMPSWTYLSQGSLNLSATLSTPGGWQRLLLHPWNFSRHEADLGGALGPAYLALLPLLVFARSSEPVRRLARISFFVWAPLGLVSQVTRYFIPALAGLSVLAAAGVEALEGKLRSAARCAAALCILAAGSAYITMSLPWNLNFDVVMGGVKPWTYLAHTNFQSHAPTPPHSGFHYIHNNTPDDAKVVLFGDARHFPLQRDHLAPSADQRSILEVWANAARTKENLRARFRDAGITHILVNHAEIFRNRTALRFSPNGKKALDEFWACCTLKEFEQGDKQDFWVAVYRVLDGPQAEAPHPTDDLWAAYKVR